MAAKIIDGKAIAATIQDDVLAQVKKRETQGLPIPCLAVVLIGDDVASQIYVNHKQAACQQAGIQSIAKRLPAETDEATLLALIDELNANTSVHGILVQLPLPNHIDANRIVECIDPKKDVDGFHPYNMGRLAQRRPFLRPCTPHGIMTLLKETGVALKGINAVVISASNIVGRPMCLELLLAGATVTVCHRFTKNLADHIKQAELLIVAIGKRNIIQSEWIKEGAIVIDVAINRTNDDTIKGDIDFETAKARASWITPVPGGVGPMTVATLLQNTLMAATHQDT